MDVVDFCTKSKVVIVVGKGGVGKTTVATTVALTAARVGLKVLVVELDGKPNVAERLGSSGELSYEPVALWSDERGGGSIAARRLTAHDALTDYLADRGLARILKRLRSSGLLDMVATAIPGLAEVLIMGKIKSLESSKTYDLIVVDAPATGHARTLLTSAKGVIDAARSGPVRTQAEEVVSLITNPERCRVMLVCLPEELPVTELIGAAFAVEDEAQVTLAPLIVNAMATTSELLERSASSLVADAGLVVAPKDLRRLEAARVFATTRAALAEAQRSRLADELPLPQLCLPVLGAGVSGLRATEILADALAEAIIEMEGDDVERA
jgi:anion-transporting  ArsA/GET3 family ATPase